VPEWDGFRTRSGQPNLLKDQQGKNTANATPRSLTGYRDQRRGRVVGEWRPDDLRGSRTSDRKREIEEKEGVQKGKREEVMDVYLMTR